MRYPISKVESVFDMSQSTIRRFEDAGLIRIRRAEDSNYRYFSMGDIARLSVHMGTRKTILPHEIKKMLDKKRKTKQTYS